MSNVNRWRLTQRTSKFVRAENQIKTVYVVYILLNAFYRVCNSGRVLIVFVVVDHHHHHENAVEIVIRI
jgi:hypothetical protein